MRKLAVALLVVSALAGCRLRTSRKSIPAPDFELKDLSGHAISLASFRGHPVMLDFWATWCGPCQMSIPLVIRFYNQHKDEGLVVLGMNVDDDPSGVYAFVKHFQMPYPVLLAGNTPVSEAYQVEGIPTFVMIDSEGKVVRYYEGFRPEMADAWEAEFQHMKAAAH